MPFNPFWAGNPTGVGQQTRAGQIIVASSPGNGNSRRSKKRKAPRAAARATARRVKKRAKPARLVKGSAAAKAYMSKIRRKRRK